MQLPTASSRRNHIQNAKIWRSNNTHKTATMCLQKTGQIRCIFNFTALHRHTNISVLAVFVHLSAYNSNANYYVQEKPAKELLPFFKKKS